MVSQLTESKLKQVVADYSSQSNVKEMLSDIAEILRERANDAQHRLAGLKHQDKYLEKLIKQDYKVAEVIGDAIDSLHDED